MRSARRWCSVATMSVRVAMVTAISLNPLSGVYAQPQPNPPSAKECSALINQASNDNLRKTMTKEQLDRTTVCLNLLKKNQGAGTSSSGIRIFRN